MNTLQRPRRCAPLMVAALCAQAACAAASAAVVTVDVTAHPGATAEDTVLVFDPLDAIPPAGRGTAVIDQINKRFVPRVSVVRTGTAVTFPNGDRIRHQVYSFSQAKKFTLKLYAGSPKVAITFDQPGLVVLGCNIHDTMVAFVGVVDTPYFAKTGATGIAALELPTGRYRLRIWNAGAAPIVPREITVTADPSRIPVVLEADSSAAGAAAWPE